MAASAPSGPHRRPYRRTDRIIVKFKDPKVAGAKSVKASKVSAMAARAGRPLRHLRRMSGDSQVFGLEKRLDLDEVEAISRRLRADPEIEYAEPDYVMQPTAVPNDSGYVNMWHLRGPADGEVAGANLPKAWDVEPGDGSVVIAVIDTGLVDTNPAFGLQSPHGDIDSRVVPGYDFISLDPICFFCSDQPYTANDGDGRDTDPSDPGDYITASEDAGTDATGGFFYGCCSGDGSGIACNSTWHGTHVAGTIGAEGNDGNGTTGVNWDARILPVRVLGKCGGYTSDIVDGMKWAAGVTFAGQPSVNPNPAKVLNLSLTGPAPSGCSSTYQNAINTIVSTKKATIVVAAGNENADAQYSQPAGCNNVITVGAVRRNGGKASYSNWGSAVEISAPGGEMPPTSDGIYSLLNTGTTTPGSDTEAFYEGTSMATPHVSGVASLLLTVDPTLTPAQVLGVIQGGARAFAGGTGNDCTLSMCGAGMLDAYGAFYQLLAPPAPINLAVTAVTVNSVSYSWTPLPTADSYNIRNPNTDALIASPSAASYTHGGLAPDTLVSLRVHGSRKTVEGPGSVLPSTATLPTPVAFVTIKPWVSSITASFGLCPANQCSGYSLEIATQSFAAGNFSAVILSSQTPNPLNNTLSVEGALANAVYYLRIGSLNQIGGPNYTNYGASVLTNTDLSPPILIGPTNITTSGMTLSWASGGNVPGVTYEAQASPVSNFSSGLVTVTGGAPGNFSALFTGLSPNTSYYFRVNALPNGPYSSPAPATPTAVLTPTSLANPYFSLTDASLALSWGSGGNPGATHHRAQMSAASDFSGAQEALVDTGFAAGFGGLNSNALYYARVRAIGHGGDESPWVVLAATYTLAHTPVNLPQTGQAPGAFAVNFDQAGNAGGTLYRVEVAENGGFSPLAASNTTTLADTAFSALKGNTVYHTRVTAFNALGTRSPYSNDVATVTMSYAPGAVTPLAEPGSKTASSFILRWAAANNDPASSYFAELFDDAALTSLIQTATVGTTQGTFTSLTPNTPVYLRVRTLPLGAPTNPASSPSVFGPVSPLAKPPIFLAPPYLPITYSSATVQWTPCASPPALPCLGYRIQASTDAAFNGALFSHDVDGNLTSVGGVPGLAADTDYFVRVGSLNQDGDAHYITLGSTHTSPANLASSTVTASGALLTLTPLFPPITSIRVVVPPWALPGGAIVTLNTSVEFMLSPPRTNEGQTAALGPKGVGFQLSAGGAQPFSEVQALLTYDPLLMPPGFDPKNIALARYDETAGQWSFLPTRVDTAQNLIVGSITHFSLFAPFFVAAGSDLSGFNVFPVPWEPGSSNDLFNAAVLTMTNLPAGARVRVVTLFGELLWEGTAAGTGILTWDGNNRFGRKVASGTYLAIFEGGGERSVRRIVIIR